MSIIHITPNFTWSEAACHDGAEVPLEYQPNARRLAERVLEPIREKFGGPLIPISWYRTAWHNQQVGGATSSQHLTASAADIRPAEMAALPRLYAVINEMLDEGLLPDLGGIGWYPGRWVHVDVRPRPADGHVARWLGQGMGSES